MSLLLLFQTAAAAGTGNVGFGAISENPISTLNAGVTDATTATLASTLGSVTVAGVGAQSFAGTLGSTLGDLTLGGVGAQSFSGTLGVTLGNLTVTGLGYITATTATLASTLGDITAGGVGSGNGTADTHDGRPRQDTSSEGQRNREKRNKEALHDAIADAMAQTLGLPKRVTPLPVEPAQPVLARPINREHRRAIADLLARSGIAPREDYSIKEIEAEIKTVERRLRENEARRIEALRIEDAERTEALRIEEMDEEEDLLMLLLS